MFVFKLSTCFPFQFKMLTRYLLEVVVFLSLAWGLSGCQTKEGGGCSVFCPCANGMQCEAGYHKCRKPGKENERCHVTRHCGPDLYCLPIYHYCQRMGNVGEKCVPSFSSAGGRRCNYQKNYWCDPFSRTCLPPSGRGNICGYLGEKEDSGECKKGLRCQCDPVCSIRGFLRDLQGALSGVAATIQDLVGKKKFCCKCV